MPTKDELFPSRWLKAVDVEPPIAVTVERVTQETVGQGTSAKRRPILYFREAVKPLVVNVTNFDTLVTLTSRDNSDHWLGAKIELFAVDVMGPSGLTRGIRIRRPKASKKKAASPPLPPPPDDIDEAMPTLVAGVADDDDEIAF